MEDREYNFIKYKVRRLLDIDLDGYKSPQMKRRLRTYLLRSGHANWPALFRAIQDDPEALRHLKDYLTINVTTFFRDPEKFEFLRTAILPEIIRMRPRIRVWSAGCLHGHETYSLAILLLETTGSYSRHMILGTDIDTQALARAQAGGPYDKNELIHVHPTWLQRYFVVDGARYRITDSLRQKVTFKSHNMLAEPFESDYDLIVCRNVVIYFEPEIKNQLYQRFYDALRPGGILFVGGTEVLSKSTEIGFEPAGISFYRRSVKAARTGP